MNEETMRKMATKYQKIGMGVTFVSWFPVWNMNIPLRCILWPALILLIFVVIKKIFRKKIMAIRDRPNVVTERVKEILGFAFWGSAVFWVMDMQSYGIIKQLIHGMLMLVMCFLAYYATGLSM